MAITRSGQSVSLPVAGIRRAAPAGELSVTPTSKDPSRCQRQWPPSRSALPTSVWRCPAGHRTACWPLQLPPRQLALLPLCWWPPWTAFTTISSAVSSEPSTAATCPPMQGEQAFRFRQQLPDVVVFARLQEDPQPGGVAQEQEEKSSLTIISANSKSNSQKLHHLC